MRSNLLQFPVKCLWALAWRCRSYVKFAFFRCLPGTYFKSVGWGTRFFGRVRFGSVEGNIVVGKNCMIGHDVFLSAAKDCVIEVGNSASLNTGCHVVAVYGIRIGNNTHVGEYCSIRDQNHAFSATDRPIAEQGFTGAPIVIEDDVWIGRGVHVCPGVRIGTGAVIGANSVVSRDVEPFAVVAGTPARVIKWRKMTPPNSSK